MTTSGLVCSTGAPVGEDAVRGQVQFADHVLHFARIVMADADDLGIRGGVGERQQMVHVPEIEIDAGDAPGFA